MDFSSVLNLQIGWWIIPSHSRRLSSGYKLRLLECWCSQLYSILNYTHNWWIAEFVIPADNCVCPVDCEISVFVSRIDCHFEIASCFRLRLRLRLLIEIDIASCWLRLLNDCWLLIEIARRNGRPQIYRLLRVNDTRKTAQEIATKKFHIFSFLDWRGLPFPGARGLTISRKLA